ncbi:hypothetical protein OPAG_07593 [Rhodococcus opacus PD630]|nr:hypothetical protein OPAG_07593 [Rhodococcus opacus PD630]NDV06963.1 hypothetical protein [Rhodococcus sp. IEGM 248]NHU43769.1 hypothetical protein [Rhodococcus sp. A14]NKY73192.1 hypothetical protein [Rhodococcus opacus]PBC55529.1 hypothetical protein CJ177_21480 [Rhodococcus sp. ACPA1]QDQ89481.1 hypothetical protein FND50_00935 [Rhodococcus sp. WB9]TQC42715.1 hypothetical protein EEB14_47295 [Rhodococcus sp. WS4]
MHRRPAALMAINLQCRCRHDVIGTTDRLSPFCSTLGVVLAPGDVAFRSGRTFVGPTCNENDNSEPPTKHNLGWPIYPLNWALSRADLVRLH